MNCPNCGKANPDIAKFCSGCGKEILVPTSKIICVRCGHENPDYVTYCGKCGVSLKYDSSKNPAVLKMDPPASKTAETSMRGVVTLQSVAKAPTRAAVSTSQEMRINPDELVQELDNIWAALDAISSRLDALERRKLV